MLTNLASFSGLGWSSMAGVVVVLIAYILNYPVGKYNVKVCSFYITRAFVANYARTARSLARVGRQETYV